MKCLLHFAMLKECPRELIVLPRDFDGELNDEMVGLFDTSNPNIKIWISGIGCNNVLYPDTEVIDYLKDCNCVYSFGLAGSINENLKVGDLVNVHSVNNLDVKIPDFSLGITEDIDADTLGCSKSSLAALSDFSSRVLCYTSNRFVTKEYLDFLFNEESGDDINTFYKDAYNICVDEDFFLGLVSGNLELDLKEDCIVCDMELFYLKKFVDIVNIFCNFYSYKLVSDIVCKSDNYKEYEGSLETLLSSLHFTVNSVFRELSSKGD